MCGYSCCYQVRFDRTKTSSALSNSAHIAQRFYGLYRAHKNIKIPKREKKISKQNRILRSLWQHSYTQSVEIWDLSREFFVEREMKWRNSKAEPIVELDRAKPESGLVCAACSGLTGYISFRLLCVEAAERTRINGRGGRRVDEARTKPKNSQLKYVQVYNNNNAGDGEEERRMNWVKVGAARE